jgi:S-DNA-T family DNA segregation ATPase FtsK/SpoIIIE
MYGGRPVGDLDLRDGDVVALELAGEGATASHGRPGDAADDEAVADLVVLGGSLSGTRVALAPGAYVVGRGPGADVVLADASLSRRHLRVVVGDEGIEVGDLGSSNGTFVDGVALTEPRSLRAGETLEAGRTLLAFEPRDGDGTRQVAARDGVVAFNRPPRIMRGKDFAGISVPAPPARREARRLPLGAALIPLAVASLMYVVTKSPVMLVLGVMTPAMAMYSWWDSRRRDRHVEGHAQATFDRRVDEAEAAVAAARAREAQHLREAAPGADELRSRALRLEPSLWERRPGDEDFLVLRLGVADRPSRIEAQIERGGDEEARRDAETRLAQHRVLAAVPVTARARGLALVGRPEHVAALARWLAVQVAALHSPAYVVVAAALSPEGADGWEWLKWLPHAAGGAHLAVGLDASSALVDTLAAPPERSTVLILDGRLGVDRARVTRLFQAGMNVIWLGADARDAPGDALTIARHDPHAARLELVEVESGETITDVTPDGVSPEWAEEVARALSPVRDAAAPDTRGSVPSRVSLLDVLALPDPTPQALAGIWQARGEDLAAPIGQTADGPFMIDAARADGLRMLIGGMPGAGKSELLQTLVAALAARHPPSRLSFLLVDYKGGAAFKDCIALPHTVGLVTDLDAHLAARAQVSLLAEVRRREALLADGGARNLAELTRRDPDRAPPSVLIVVDEFAALVREVPAFVDTVVDVAQRGRSLGLHLVLATQRPRGAVNDTIRANTNLRIAMRVADAAESSDIIEAGDAAEIAAGLPGRALALTGRRAGGAPELTEFQAAYAGGSSSGIREVEVRVAPFRLGVPYARAARVLSLAGAAGPTDLQAIVQAAEAAAERLGIPRPAAPWLPPLPDRVDLLELEPPADRGQAVLGLVDDPERQRQAPFVVDLERDGSLLVFGTSGSGKTSLLRTMAASLAAHASPAELQLYALDFASRGLRPLEALPHCGSVIAGSDQERVLRLLGSLRRAMAQRRDMLASVGVAAVSELDPSAAASEAPPRIVVLLDGYAQFAAAFDRVAFGEPVQTVQQIASEGRPLGLHLVVTADRRADVPGALAGVVTSRLVLRMADQDDFAAFGVPRSALGAPLPPGRGFTREGLEVQVATVDIEALAPRLAERHPGLRAPRIRALPAQVSAERLPAAPAPLMAVAGLGGEALTPLVVDLREDHFLVSGAVRSGRSTALAALTASLRRGTPGLECHLLAPRRSPLTAEAGWSSLARDPQECRTLADRLVALTERPPAAPPVLVVVDDGTELSELTALETLVRRGRDAGVRVLAAVETHAAQRAFGGWIRELRNAQRGLLLAPDLDADGELLGVRLPRTALAPPAAGRGCMVADGAVEQVQVAIPASAP